MTMSPVFRSGLSIVPVPTIQAVSRKEASEKEKKDRKEAKRMIARRRSAYEKTLKERVGVELANAISQFNALSFYTCRGHAESALRTGARRLVAGEPIQMRTFLPSGDPYLTSHVTTRSDGSLYVPRPLHTFRRKVTQGESEAEFNSRVETAFSFAMARGYSMLHEACHCEGCRDERGRTWNSIKDMKDEKAGYVFRMMVTWDRDNNPFSANYRYRENRAQATSRRVDEQGNRRISGRPCPGTSGSTFSDPKAKGSAARLVGLEVEHNVDVRQSYDWAARWSGAQVIGDGSCGREAVTPPLAGENIAKCLTDLCKALNDGNAGCDSRCGLHVHVDARDMRWADMLRFLTVYCRIESLLFLLGGQNRYSKPGAGHGYCLPVAELYGQALSKPDPKGAIIAAAVLGDRSAEEGRSLMRNNPPGKKAGGRYKSINIMPWLAGRAFHRKDTTVEFRLHRGSHNAERITRWAHICQDIVHWCINASNADVDALPKSAARALCVISPRNKDWIIRRLLGWRASTTAGKVPLEDDVGNKKPRRIVTLKNGMYSVDTNRCSYRRDE